MVSFYECKKTAVKSQAVFNLHFMRNGSFQLDGGGRGIRTPARFDPPVGFQDRSLQPDLGIPPYLIDKV
jgi:hypothetical protein